VRSSSATRVRTPTRRRQPNGEVERRHSKPAPVKIDDPSAQPLRQQDRSLSCRSAFHRADLTRVRRAGGGSSARRLGCQCNQDRAHRSGSMVRRNGGERDGYDFRINPTGTSGASRFNLKKCRRARSLYALGPRRTWSSRNYAPRCEEPSRQRLPTSAGHQQAHLCSASISGVLDSTDLMRVVLVSIQIAQGWVG